MNNMYKLETGGGMIRRTGGRRGDDLEHGGMIRRMGGMFGRMCVGMFWGCSGGALSGGVALSSLKPTIRQTN